jgi:hypothetical protein
MGVISKLLYEFKSLNLLAIEGYFFYFLDSLYWFITYGIMGYYGKGNLGPIILALAIYNLCAYFLEGILFGQIILVKSSYIKTSSFAERIDKYWLSISAGMIVVYTIISSGVFLAFNWYFYFFLGVRSKTALKAIQFSWLLFPSFLFNGFQKSFQQHLMQKGSSPSVLISMIVGVLANFICKYDILDLLSCSSNNDRLWGFYKVIWFW